MVEPLRTNGRHQHRAVIFYIGGRTEEKSGEGGEKKGSQIEIGGGKNQSSSQDVQQAWPFFLWGREGGGFGKGALFDLVSSRVPVPWREASRFKHVGGDGNRESVQIRALALLRENCGGWERVCRGERGLFSFGGGLEGEEIRGDGTLGISASDPKSRDR